MTLSPIFKRRLTVISQSVSLPSSNLTPDEQKALKGLKTTEAEEGQSKNILQIQKNILNRNVFLKSLSKSLTNLKNYCKS